MNTDNETSIIITRKIFTEIAGLIFYDDKDKKIQSATMYKWLQIALSNKEVYRLTKLTFAEFLLFCDICVFKHSLKDDDVKNYRVDNATFNQWRCDNPELTTNADIGKHYLKMVAAENVLSQGRQLIAYWNKNYPGVFARYDFYNFAKSYNLKFHMGAMDKDDLIKLNGILERNKYRAKRSKSKS